MKNNIKIMLSLIIVIPCALEAMEKKKTGSIVKNNGELTSPRAVSTEKAQQILENNETANVKIFRGSVSDFQGKISFDGKEFTLHDDVKLPKNLAQRLLKDKSTKVKLVRNSLVKELDQKGAQNLSKLLEKQKDDSKTFFELKSGELLITNDELELHDEETE